MSISAIRAIEKFRILELKGLSGYIARNGPLSAVPEESTSRGVRLANPFLPHRNPKTGRWAPPKYSLRRQAELIKKAKETNCLHLLPPGPKLHKPEVMAEILRSRTAAAAASSKAGEIPKQLEHLAFQVDWVGKFEVKEKPEAEQHVPLYAGKKRMFKGHKWERTMDRRLNHRAMLLRDMDKRVRRFKAYHRKKKPNPLKPAKRVSSKLPF
ncbi:hypothetical protein E1B28_004636 [Marasmius oreades]|uniref:Large ribosomal subunit protein mL59 domain-containing protein n=1 Tax=Marasmius oreades TaxID=181124 RepID=A0A9P7UYZ4_9AGAR|nr:uncharacterized protein E1B28_004636 [Marasmius oreades]KAG7097270.1 hypothetical protein E1B28_004636 [Marasmius oreades]